MATSTNISIRMDAETKAKADALSGEFGMNLTTAFNIFVRQSRREGKIPFELCVIMERKKMNKDLHLICALPHPGFDSRRVLHILKKSF